MIEFSVRGKSDIVACEKKNRQPIDCLFDVDDVTGYCESVTCAAT